MPLLFKVSESWQVGGRSGWTRWLSPFFVQLSFYLRRWNFLRIAQDLLSWRSCLLERLNLVWRYEDVRLVRWLLVLFIWSFRGLFYLKLKLRVWLRTILWASYSQRLIFLGWHVLSKLKRSLHVWLALRIVTNIATQAVKFMSRWARFLSQGDLLF